VLFSEGTRDLDVAFGERRTRCAGDFAKGSGRVSVSWIKRVSYGQVTG